MIKDPAVSLDIDQDQKTKISEENLLRLIRHDLETSLFTGEGHRKIHARLKRQKINVGRKRVLRLMREHNLLSPHRVEQGKVNLHVGRITTDRPNEMWGVDGVKVETLADGWVWVFWSVEHWNAECVGWHVAKRGDRYAALEPVAMGVKENFGSIDAGIASGLQLRSDHGSQYMSVSFTNQIRHWGITPSRGFVREPETNGVVERFNKTFKEQVIHGRCYEGIEVLRLAVGAFVSDYNEHWLIEKLGYQSPLEAKREWVRSSSTATPEGVRGTATTSIGCRPKGDIREISKADHRDPSEERDTATTSIGMAIVHEKRCKCKIRNCGMVAI